MSALGARKLAFRHRKHTAAHQQRFAVCISAGCAGRCLAANDTESAISRWQGLANDTGLSAALARASAVDIEVTTHVVAGLTVVA